VLNWLSITPWRCMGVWRRNSNIIYLSINRSWMVSFMTLPPCTLGKSLNCPMYMFLGGTHSRSRRYGAEKNLTSAGNWTAATGVAIPTELFRLYNCNIPYHIMKIASNDVTGTSVVYICQIFEETFCLSNFRTEEHTEYPRRKGQYSGMS
jgi:hypothetical protein